MLAGAKGTKRETDPREAGPEEAWGEASKSAKRKEQQLGPHGQMKLPGICLLYTSDAADDIGQV